MESYLDKLEATASLCNDLGCGITVNIQCTREKFKLLWEEIEDEYDFTVVEDVKVTQEKIPNQLSNLYVVRLHKQLFTFHIKD